MQWSLSQFAKPSMINETSQSALSTTPNRLSRSPIIKHEPREDDTPAMMVKQENNELNDLNPYDTHQRFDPHNKSPSPAKALQAPLLSPLNKLDVSDLVEPSEIEKLLAETKAHAKLSPINSLSDADEQKVDKRRIKREHREHRKSQHEMAIGASSDSEEEEEGGRSSDATSRRAFNCDERVTARVPSGHSSAESSGKEKQRARHRPPKKPKGRRQSMTIMAAQKDSDNNNTILTTNNNSSNNNGSSRTSNPTVPQQSPVTTTTKGKGMAKPVTPEKGRTKGGRGSSSNNNNNSSNPNNNLKKRLVPMEENRDSIVIKSAVSPLSETSSSSSEGDGDDDDGGNGKARVTARGPAEEQEMEVEEGEIEAKTKRRGSKLVNGGGGATSNDGSSSSSSSSGDSSNSSSSSSEDEDEEGEEEAKKDLFEPVKKRTPSQQLLSPKVTMLRKPSGLSDENSNSMSSPNHRRPRHNSLSKTQLSSPAANIKGATPSSVHSDRSTGSGSKKAAGRGTPKSNQGSAAATVAAKKGSGGKSNKSGGSGNVKTAATVASSDASNDSEVDSEEERKTKSDKKKNDTLRKLFSSHSKGEGGAKGAKGGKGKGQVVIVDHSEEAHVSSGVRGNDKGIGK